MEIFLMGGILIAALVVVDLRNSHRVSALRSDFTEGLTKTKTSIKDSLAAKKNIYQTDTSEVTQAYIRALEAGKQIKVFDQANMTYIETLMLEKYGETMIGSEVVMNKKNRMMVDHYIYYLKQ